MQNIINNIKISNLEVDYVLYPDECERFDELYVFEIINEKNTKECKLNILPNSQKKIHFLLHTEVDEGQYIDYMRDDYRLYITFDMELVGIDNHVNKNTVVIHLSKELDESIVGKYSVDCVNINLKKI